MNRRDLLGALLSLPFVRWFIPGAITGYRVETLEHEGWGVKEYGSGKSHYAVQMTFSSKQEAEAFVQSLFPVLLRIFVFDDDWHMSQLRSGYRDAVRAQFKGTIQRMEVGIWSEQDGKLVFLHHPAFWSIENAWAYLENIRINGEPVSRPSSTGRISSYLVQPFKKGDCEIIRVADVDEWCA
jgi:hypothetical protein